MAAELQARRRRRSRKDRCPRLVGQALGAERGAGVPAVGSALDADAALAGVAAGRLEGRARGAVLAAGGGCRTQTARPTSQRQSDIFGRLVLTTEKTSSRRLFPVSLSMQ